MQIGEGVTGGDADDSTTGPAQQTQGGSLTLRFVEILGLYRPGHDDSGERGSQRSFRAGYELGYTSADDLGRIYVNHRPRRSASEGWARVRAKNRQYIDLIVEVDDPSGSLPATATLEWTCEDPDDPSDAGMNTEAARLIDGRGTGGDNRGRCDHPRPRGSSDPTFAQITGFALSGRRANGCRTRIGGGQSKVRFHCTNVGGDNYIIRVRITGQPPTEIATGLMSMWKRTDVEYHKLANTRDIPLDQVAAAFEPAFIQLDFTQPIAFTMPAHSNGRRYMTRGRALLAPARALARRLFRNVGRPGWFLLVAADLESSATSTSQDLYSGSARIVTGPHPQNNDPRDWVVVDQVLTQPVTSVKIIDGTRSLTLYADRQQAPPPNLLPTQSAVLLGYMKYHPEPALGHGSYYTAVGVSSFMYSDCCYQSATQQYHVNCGLRLAGTINVELRGGYSIGASGITPIYPAAGRLWFGGRTLVFTGLFDQDPAVYEEQVLRTTVHELCHGFGFAHACGNHSALGSGNQACPMHILDHWLVDPSSIRSSGHASLEQWESGSGTIKFCAGHLLGLRRTHLEQNLGLWRWP